MTFWTCANKESVYFLTVINVSQEKEGKKTLYLIGAFHMSAQL